MTVAAQGFCVGPAGYNARDALYLCNIAEKASPASFWSGTQLIITAAGNICPTRKFTTDRIVFRDGKALPYGAEEQILVASSEFENCFFLDRNIDQRIQYLNKLEEEWDDGVQWADEVMEELRDGFDFEREKKKAWTNEWEKQWKAFVANKEFNGKKGRICWRKYEWRFFKEICQGRSLVTGQVLHGNHGNIDRVFNNDGYALNNCIMIEQGLNFAKRDMSEFKTSIGFQGPCKLQFGVERLREAVKDLLDHSRSLRLW
ncbi:hypothetical protein BGZ70_009789 [Mortierella alpina]|uniref:Uncharacterized protein n=1 Tax=Mortierella alpina TaxID=64518 RepID=A0A9P6M0E2_MORAP|nr:hypothetical protein BGZ70_009789 [Mortierella alpina]